MIPGGASGQSGINLQTFDTNQFLEFYGIKKLGEEKTKANIEGIKRAYNELNLG